MLTRRARVVSSICIILGFLAIAYSVFRMFRGDDKGAMVGPAVWMAVAHFNIWFNRREIKHHTEAEQPAA